MTTTITLDRASYRPGQILRAQVATTLGEPSSTPLTLGGVDGNGNTLRLQGSLTTTPRLSYAWRWAGGVSILGTGPSIALTVPSPPSATLIVEVRTDSALESAGVSIPIARMRLGADCTTLSTPAAWGASFAALTAGRVVTGTTKLFWSEGKGLPVVGKYPVPAGVRPQFCFVDWPDLDDFAAFLATLPADSDVTWLQEGDRGKGYTAAEFCARWDQLYDVAEDAPNRSTFSLVPNLTYTWQHSKNNDNYGPWVPPRLDKLGVDIYVGGNGTPDKPYGSMAQALEVPVRVAAERNVDLVVPEWAVVVPLLSTPEMGTGRAQWITRSLTEMDDVGVASSAWWNASPSQQVGTFILTAGAPDWAALRDWWDTA